MIRENHGLSVICIVHSWAAPMELEQVRAPLLVLDDILGVVLVHVKKAENIGRFLIVDTAVVQFGDPWFLLGALHFGWPLIVWFAMRPFSGKHAALEHELPAIGGRLRIAVRVLGVSGKVRPIPEQMA